MTLEEPANKSFAVLKLLLVGLLVFYAWKLLFGHQSFTFLDNINLPIHEFGHLLFTPFGEFMHFLGGSLFQIIFPMIMVGAFFFKRDPFAAGICLFWAGQSMINVSYYVADARAQELPLIGGQHDWDYLLSELSWLQYDTKLGTFVFICGAFVIIAGLLLSTFIAIREGGWVAVRH